MCECVCVWRRGSDVFLFAPMMDFLRTDVNWVVQVVDEGPDCKWLWTCVCVCGYDFQRASSRLCHTPSPASPSWESKCWTHIFSFRWTKVCYGFRVCNGGMCAMTTTKRIVMSTDRCWSISDTNINQVTGFRQCSDAYGVKRFWTIEQKSCRSCELKKTTNTLYVPSVPELNCYSISKSRIYRHLDHHLYLHLNHESPMTNTNSNHVFRTLLSIV